MSDAGGDITEVCFAQMAKYVTYIHDEVVHKTGHLAQNQNGPAEAKDWRSRYFDHQTAAYKPEVSLANEQAVLQQEVESANNRLISF